MIFHCTSRRNTGSVVIMVQHQSTLVFTHVTEELCMLMLMFMLISKKMRALSQPAALKKESQKYYTSMLLVYLCRTRLCT